MSNVVFLGPKGSYTHQASLEHFSSEQLKDAISIEDIFAQVEQGEADLGVLPIENSIEGAVTHSLDCLMQSDLKIIKEIELPISHVLYTAPNVPKTIDRLYSHPQAFAQCKAFIKKHYPKASCVIASSTSNAIERMLTDSNSGAIAGPHVVEYFDLSAIEENIQDNPNNTTRFLVIGKQTPLGTKDDKTSLMLALGDKPGTLVNLLSPFSLLNINLTKIESRPVGNQKWVNVFFIDMEGHIEDKRIQMALNLLEMIGVQVKHLGSYPRYQGA